MWRWGGRPRKHNVIPIHALFAEDAPAEERQAWLDALKGVVDYRAPVFNKASRSFITCEGIQELFLRRRARHS